MKKNKGTKKQILYQENYKADVQFNKEVLPVLKHANSIQPVRMDLKAVGVIQIGDTKFEFQDLRLYFPHEESEIE